MFRNNIKIAFRNLVKNRESSFINIGGLTVGLTVALLIGLWIYDELSFNKYYENYDRIGRILIRGNDAKEGPFISNSLPYPLATEIRESYSGNFKRIVRSSWDQDYIISAGEKKLSAPGLFMDEDAPQMFGFKMLKGSRTGLKDRNSIIISSSTAKALFGDSDPINQLMLINNKIGVTVTGVFEDIPKNAEFNAIKFFSTWDLWVSENKWILERATNDWMNHFLRIYCEIKPEGDLQIVNRNISGAELLKIKDIDKYKEHAARHPEVFLHPMKSWHLHPLQRDGLTDNKPLRMVWLVGIIGMFVLILACINFMNLSTARSQKRAKEIGILKAIGSRRVQLVVQFFTESYLFVSLSFLLAFILGNAALPWFNDLAGKEMHFPLSDINFWLACAGFCFLTGFLAGSYPAFYLTSFKPIKVLKGVLRAGRVASIPRKSLVVMQFTVSVALIICTIVVYRQLQFAKERPVGYTREGLIMLEMKSQDFDGKYDVFRTALLNTGMVASVSQSMGKVTEVASGNNGFDWKGKDPGMDESFGTLAVTHEHGKTAGWQFISGRDFSREHASDSAGVVINESAAKYMRLQNPVGETITWKWRDNPPKPYKILGVIRDMVMESPYEPIEPTLFFVKALNGGVNWMNIRIRPEVSTAKAIPAIEKVFKQLTPAIPFDYKFVDQDYALKFAAEERIGRLVRFFAILAVIISCLGLFGLASFMAEQRTREVGVRKVLGASVFNLWQLLSREFVFLVGLSIVIAVPVAYYFMSNWLQDYSYRTDLSWWIFAVAGLGAIVIAMGTVSFQAVKAALANPVKSLRTE
jgi:putative ABC transport system permease protein